MCIVFRRSFMNIWIWWSRSCDRKSFFFIECEFRTIGGQLERTWWYNCLDSTSRLRKFRAILSLLNGHPNLMCKKTHFSSENSIQKKGAQSGRTTYAPLFSDIMWIISSVIRIFLNECKHLSTLNNIIVKKYINLSNLLDRCIPHPEYQFGSFFWMTFYMFTVAKNRSISILKEESMKGLHISLLGNVQTLLPVDSGRWKKVFAAE